VPQAGILADPTIFCVPIPSPRKYLCQNASTALLQRDSTRTYGERMGTNFDQPLYECRPNHFDIDTIDGLKELGAILFTIQRRLVSEGRMVESSVYGTSEG
jgi:hypothetical protein